MSKVAVVLSHGLHPPWNMGEIALSKMYADVLSHLYDKVTVLSIVDHVRGFNGFFKPSRSNMAVRYFNNHHDLNAYLSKLVYGLRKFDIHLMNYSLLSLSQKIARRTNVIFLYQYTPENVRAPLTPFKARFLELLSLVRSDFILITPSPTIYMRCRRYGNRSCVYVPPPIVKRLEWRGENHVIEAGKPNSILRLVYIGHADYHRFPFVRIFRVLREVIKDSDEAVSLKICISRQGYTNYREFAELMRKYVQRLDLEDVVHIEVRNLNKAEKEKLLQGSDVFLFPALYPVAIDPPLTILEAMLHGNVVVASDTQSIPRILSNDRGMVIHRRECEKSLYDAIMRLFNDANLIPKMKNKAVRYVRYVCNFSAIIRYLSSFMGIS